MLREKSLPCSLLTWEHLERQGAIPLGTSAGMTYLEKTLAHSEEANTAPGFFASP